MILELKNQTYGIYDKFRIGKEIETEMVNSINCPTVDNRLLLSMVLLPTMLWWLSVPLINLLELSLSHIRLTQIGSGVAMYLLLIIGYGNGINKFHEPDYSLKFTSMFFASSFGCWLAYISIVEQPNGFIGLVMLICSLNSFLYYYNMMLAEKDNYVVANEKLSLALHIINGFGGCVSTIIGFYAILWGEFVFPY